MNNVLRTSLVLGVLAVAAASQALTLRYAGTAYGVTPPATGFNTISLGYLGDDYSFGASRTVAANTTTGTITLYDTLAGLLSNSANKLVLNYTLDNGANQAVTATATATGFGTYAGTTGTGIRIARLNVVGYDILIQGTTAVPEPASLAALSVGAVALLRRRRKA